MAALATTGCGSGVDRTPAAVAVAAERFRDMVGCLVEPGGLTRANVGEAAGWFDFLVWDLLDANDAVLEEWGSGGGEAWL